MKLRLRQLAPLLALACAHHMLTLTADDWVPTGGPAPDAEPLPREPCAENTAQRRAFFGDLHVHTAHSFDARSRDMLGTPDDAYRFARGEPIGLGPFDAKGRGTRTAQLERPLDFAAVTDHAEWIGEVSLCTQPGSRAYNTRSCAGFRGEAAVRSPIPGIPGGQSRMFGLIGRVGRNQEICGPEALWCRDALRATWLETQRATEDSYDRTPRCSFTSFHGWEYSNSPGQSKVHRNVIFRNEIVPELPISSLEEPDPLGLWEELDARCNSNGTRCEAVAIPHNPNMSNGRLFAIPYRGESLAEQRRQAALRARIEPIVEMMQVKGESECRNGLYDVAGEDELCDFEKVRGIGSDSFPDCEDGFGTGAMAGKGCESRLDFVRYALVEGMREEARIGMNPYRFGFVGGTDTHNATPGDVEESSFQGCCANSDATVEQRLSPAPSFAGKSRARRNPGGLMGVWSEENTRDALFDAIGRRETFATSGPRIVPRFFGGWEYPEDLCERQDLVEQGYAQGVAMGGVLPPLAASRAPVFVVSVLRDPGAPGFPGGQLQRVQIVKAWSGDDGRFHQAVHEIAPHPQGEADVDLATCTPRGPGHDAVCGVWTDPDFDSATAAAYYVRVVENPSCRWSFRACLALPEADRPATCTDPTIPRVIQERAWTSPIWYSPSST